MMMMSDNNGNIKAARHQHQHELHSSRVTSNGHAHPKVALSDLAQAHQAHQVVHPSSIVLVSSNDISSPEMITSPSSHSTISTPSPMSVSNCIPQFVHPNDNDAINNNSSLVTQSNTTSNRLASQANNNNQANLSTSSVVNSTSTTMTNSAGNTTTPSTTPIFALPDILESIQRSDHFPLVRHRWNTNEEIAALLIAIDRHDNWLSLEVKIRPKSGSMMLYSRKRVRYRRDGYCWKKRKDGKTTREDHMKLKVQGIECIYGCYVHSAILPTFHRRCYWLLQNPDIVLVHYLNVPYNDDNKVITPSLNFFIDSRKEWTRDDLICELKPMFLNENENDLSDQLEKSTIDTVESIVAQLMVRQRAKLKALEDSNVDAPMGRNCNGAKLAAIQPASNAHLKQFAHKHHQQQQLQIISGLSQSGHAIIGTTNLGRGKGQGSGNCTVNTVANGKRDVSTACTMISTAALQAAEEDNTGIDVNGNLIAANQSKAIQPAATVQLVQLTSPHGMCQLSGASATAGTAAGTLVDGATLGHPQTSPTSLILNLSGLQAPAGSSFFILNSTTTSQTSALSVSGAHHQLTNTTRLVNTVTSEAANAQATTGTGTPVAFFYPTRTGSTNELTTTRLLCTNGLPSALGGSFVTESVVKSSIFANGTLDPSVMTSILGGGSGGGDELKHVTIKQEFDEDNNEMEMDSSCVHAELINNKRFNLDEDEEEKMMICSEPSSPERLINSNLTAFLTDGQDIKLEPDFLVSEHQHGNNSQCCHSKSHSTLNTSDLTNDENDFDWKFDSLFGNDSSLMSSCLQNEHNFGYSGSKSSLVTDHLMSSTSHASHFSSSPNSSHPMIIHHRNPHTHHHQPATQTQNTFLASHSSQRDINLNQSSAMHVSSHEQHSPFDGHSMDFMDNEDIPTSDEILFGLDAFDIFSDFDHLVDDLSEDSHTNHHQQHQSPHCANQANDSGSGNNVHSDCVYSNGQQCYRQSPLCNASLSTITSSSSSASTVTISLSSSSSSGLLSSGSSSQYNSPSTESASTTASQLSNYKGNHVGNCLTSNATTSVSANLSPTVGHNRDNSSSNQTATASAGNKKCLGSTLIIDHSNGNEIDSAASRQPLTNEHQQPDHVNPSESDVCHSIAVTVDENGNVSMVRTSSNTNTIGNSNQNNGSTTRRAASAGHQSRQAHLKELNQVHKSSDTSLNDISDGDEGHSQFVSNYPHRTRQRHMSDIYSSGHSGRSSKETISDRSSTRGAVHDSNGNNISSSTRTSRSTNTTATIADYSPEWCYPEGGIKVLVAGPWYHTETDTYSIHFDGVSVPTQLVQTGLLRCFSPKHEPGFVTLQVSCNDLIISNSVIFEYRAHTEVSPQKTPDYFSFDENLFRATLLERCDKLNRASSSTGGSNNELLKQFLLDNNGNMSHQANNSQFESRLVQWFDSLLSSGVVNVTAQHNENDQFEDKSFLHLAVGLNLPQLTERALRVHSKLSQSLSDEQKKKCFFFGQVDPSARDLEDNTPLSWACWLGHVELVEMFVRHEPNVIHHTNSTGQTPLDIAIERGHHRIARLIEMSQMSSTSNQATTDKCPSTTSTNNNSNNLNNANDHLSDDNNKPGKNKASALTATASLMAKLTDIKAMSSGVCCRQWDDNNRLEGKESLVHCCSSSIDCATVNKKANTVGHKNIDSTLTDDDSMSEENSSSSRAVLTIAENIIAAMPHRIKSNVIESINSGEMSLDSYVQSDDDRLESSIKGGKPDEAKFDLQSLDDLILYLEQQHNQLSHLERTESECSGSSEIDYYYSTGNRLLSTNSGQHSLASQDSLESCSFGEAESLTLMSYRDVQRSPSLANSSPSNSIDGTNSIYSPSNYSLDSLPSSPPPTTSELCEYFRSGSITSELSNLTLTECEQRELYEAAQVIQKAYRLYKGRKDHLESLKHENSAESAAIIIQNYYRRYKQYLYYCNNQTSKGRKDKIVLSEPMEHHSSEPKRFKKSVTTYDEITDDEVDEGMYSCTTGTASSDISMSNSTAQSDVDDDDSGQGAIEDIDEGVITAFCGGTFSSEEDNDDETLVKLYDTNTSLQVKGSTSRATYRAQHTINHNNKRSLLQ